jgi:hypothetical protein
MIERVGEVRSAMLADVKRSTMRLLIEEIIVAGALINTELNNKGQPCSGKTGMFFMPQKG